MTGLGAAEVRETATSTLRHRLPLERHCRGRFLRRTARALYFSTMVLSLSSDGVSSQSPCLRSPEVHFCPSRCLFARRFKYCARFNRSATSGNPLAEQSQVDSCYWRSERARDTDPTFNRITEAACSGRQPGRAGATHRNAAVAADPGRSASPGWGTQSDYRWYLAGPS